MKDVFVFEDDVERKTPQTFEEKLQEAIDTLRLATKISWEYYNDRLIIAYSGGKDSDVLLDIALRHLNPWDIEVRNSHTTVDAPDTVRHIEKVFKRLKDKSVKTSYANRYPVRKTMWELIVEHRIPPTGLVRYCCEELKESSTGNRFTALGVREDESVKRRGRDLFR